MLIGSQDFQVRSAGDVAGVYHGLTGGLERGGQLVALMKAQTHLLEVEDDVGHVLFDARDGGELVKHALDTHRDDRVARQRR